MRFGGLTGFRRSRATLVLSLTPKVIVIEDQENPFTSPRECDGRRPLHRRLRYQTIIIEAEP